MAVVQVDDVTAQRELTATLERFRGEPRVALGLSATDDAAAARRVFMGLCKIYHPAKFARFAPPTVKLSNEVFLAIRRAYEAVAGPTPRASGSSPPPSGRPSTPTGAVPAPRPSTPTGAVPAPRPSTPTGAVPAPRPSTPTGAVPSLRAPTSSGPVAAPRAATASSVPPPSSPPPPSTTERPTVRVARPHATPATGIPVTGRAPGAPRTTPPVGIPRVPAPAAPPPAAAAPRPVRPATVSPQDSAALFDRALEHVRRQRWADARSAFGELAAQHPGEPRYRAYLHYARGWEAFGLGKDGEARAEWQRAAASDPSNGLARQALESTGLAK